MKWIIAGIVLTCALLIGLFVWLLTSDSKRNCTEGQITYERHTVLVGKTVMIVRTYHDSKGECEP